MLTADYIIRMERADRWPRRPRVLPQECELCAVHICLRGRGLDLLQRGEFRRATDRPPPRVRDGRLDDIHQAAKLQPPDHVRLHPYNVVRNCVQGHEVPAACDIWNISCRASLTVTSLRETWADSKSGLSAMHASGQPGTNPKSSSTCWLELANPDL